jgi:hypothetical protein
VGVELTAGLSGDRVPKLIEFHHSLGETVVGKVLRRELRTQEQRASPQWSENWAWRGYRALMFVTAAIRRLRRQGPSPWLTIRITPRQGEAVSGAHRLVGV